MWHRKALVLLIKIIPPRFNPEKAEISTTPAEVTGSDLRAALVRIFYLNLSGFRMFLKDTIANKSVMSHFV